MAIGDEGKKSPPPLPEKSDDPRTPPDQPDPDSDHMWSVGELIRSRFGIGR